MKVRLTRGGLVGPPWQQRENGYIVRGATGSSNTNVVEKPSVYIEPHVEFFSAELRAEAPVDITITPISWEGKPAFDLVHGPKDTMR